VLNAILSGHEEKMAQDERVGRTSMAGQEASIITGFQRQGRTNDKLFELDKKSTDKRDGGNTG
jgi:hypothetical protein